MTKLTIISIFGR